MGVLKLLDCCPKLTGLELPANSRIDGASIEAMVDGKRPEGRYLKALSLVRDHDAASFSETCLSEGV